MEKLIRDWEDAVRLAGATTRKINAYTSAGLAAPDDLVMEMAVREDAVLITLMAIRKSRPPDGAMH